MEKAQVLVEHCEIDIFFLLHFSKLLQAKTISVSTGSSSYAGLLSFDYLPSWKKFKKVKFSIAPAYKSCAGKPEETKMVLAVESLWRRKKRRKNRHRFDVYFLTISIGSVAYLPPQYTYQDSKLLAPDLIFWRIEFKPVVYQRPKFLAKNEGFQPSVSAAEFKGGIWPNVKFQIFSKWTVFIDLCKYFWC